MGTPIISWVDDGVADGGPLSIYRNSTLVLTIDNSGNITIYGSGNLTINGGDTTISGISFLQHTHVVNCPAPSSTVTSEPPA
jgi:hypothetical protein